MGYQALLFCPDEKLARVLSQIFSELDFAVDPVNERDAVLEKLKARHYDAVVADCDNEEIAAPLLKSAHISGLNQGSLAIAVVEGQAGIAKAYRIGANLVLTKPINVEQAKGTLRVARGLLRKNADSVAASAIPSATPAPSPGPVGRSLSIEVTNRNVAAPPTPVRSQPPDFDASLLAMEAMAKIEEKLAHAPAAAAPTQTPVVARPSAATSLFSAAEAVSQAKTAAPTSAAAPVVSIASKTQATAAAPAPAKEGAAPPRKQVEETQQWEELESAAPAAASHSSAGISEAPAFAAMEIDAGRSDNSRKILIAAVVLALVAAGYFGYTRFGQTHSSPLPQPTAPAPQNGAAPVQEIRPMSAPAPAPSISSVNRADAVPNTPAPRISNQPVQISAADSSVTKIGLRTENEARASAPAPLMVKPAAPTVKPQPPAEDPAAPPPGSLAIASNSDSGLNSVLTAGATTVAKPTLVRVKVSQGVSQGLLIKHVPPKYPPNALAAHIQGAVEIEATVNKEGNVINPKVLRGDPTLAAAALAAVRQWRYKPYYLDGEPVEIQTQITVNFKAY
jgi:protein TonB